MIICNIAVFVVKYFSRCVRETIPYRFAFTVFIPAALNLLGGGGRAPNKLIRKNNLIRHNDIPFEGGF